MAACATLAARLPFVAFNPDWGPTVSEHCHLLTSPEIHAHRSALAGDSPVPYWQVNPEQMILHYHGGSYVISYAVGVLSHLLDSRTLLPLKILGLICTLAYTISLALLLAFVTPPGRNRGLVWAPLFLAACPPVFFLWVTLVPLGHYYETHVFYGLFVAAALLGWSGHLKWPVALVVGVLCGLAVFYTLSNLVFVVLVVLMLALSSRLWVSDKAAQIAAVLGGTTIVLLLSGRLTQGWNRIRHSLASSSTGDAAATGVTGDLSPWEIVLEHVALLFGRHGQETEILLQDRGEQALVLGSCGLAALVSAFLLYHACCALHPVWRRRQKAREAFLAANGFVLVAFAAAYVLLDPYTQRGGSARIEYLVPIFPPLFAGVGAAIDRGLAARPGYVKAGVLALAAGCALVQLWGWSDQMLFNARPLDRPPVGSCDAHHVHGYFWDLPDNPDVRPREASWTDLLSLRDGERRCIRSRPGEEDACVYTALVLGALAQPGEPRCDAWSGDLRLTCVRAWAAVEQAQETCADPMTPPAGCDDLEEPLRAACISGAYQGNSIDKTGRHCFLGFAARCQATFEDPAALAACLEQSSALLVGMPALPAPPESLPAACVSWPGPWAGLCARGVALAAEPPATTTGASCESVYRERFAHEVPAERSLPYHQCLFDGAIYYPYCSIGIARSRGEVDCRWTQGLEP